MGSCERHEWHVVSVIIKSYLLNAFARPNFEGNCIQS